MVRKEKQLSIFLENRPGGLAKVCGILAESGINIVALTVHDTVDHAIVRVLADRPIKALLIMEQHGLYILETDVVVMEVSNQAGVLAELSRTLAHADINIDYAYCTSTERQGVGCIVMKTEDVDKTVEILSGKT